MQCVRSLLLRVCGDLLAISSQSLISSPLTLSRLGSTSSISSVFTIRPFPSTHKQDQAGECLFLQNPSMALKGLLNSKYTFLSPTCEANYNLVSMCLSTHISLCCHPYLRDTQNELFTGFNTLRFPTSRPLLVMVPESESISFALLPGDFGYCSNTTFFVRLF